MGMIDRICRKTVDSASEAIKEKAKGIKMEEIVPILIAGGGLLIAIFGHGSTQSVPQVNVQVHVHIPSVTASVN